MSGIAPWGVTALLIAVAYFWAAALVGRGGLLTYVVTLAFGTGGIALVMFWSAFLTGGWTLAGIIIAYGIFAAVGVAFWRQVPDHSVQFSASRLEWGSIAIILLIAAAVLFNGAYYPFSKADALGIYHPAALAMTQTGTLQPLTGADSLYRTYPVLVPLNYTFAYLVSGWENEYLAKALATLMSLGCLPAVYLLGREIGGRRIGLLAALTLALTPSFVRWGSSGYVDLPMAFTYTLSALFALRFWRSGRLVDAALAGVMLGFACFTKNAGLIGVPLLAAWLLGATIWSQRRNNISLRSRVLASTVSLGLCALIAAPWYLRNLSGAGFLIPATAWTDQAERSLRTLLIFITLPDNFLVSGWLALAGIGFVGWRLIRPEADRAGLALILWFTLPFFAAWWVFVSYDPRFLLLFYPILCVGAAALVDFSLTRFRLPRLAQMALAVGVVVIACYCLWIAVEFKGDIVRNPLMSNEEKIALVRDTP